MFNSKLFQQKINTLSQKIDHKNLYFSPNIPNKKILGAMESSELIQSKNELLLVIDDTVWGSAKDGFFVTANFLISKSAFNKAEFIKLEDVNQIAILGNNIIVNKYEFCHLSLSKEDDLADLFYALDEIIKSCKSVSKNKITTIKSESQLNLNNELMSDSEEIFKFLYEIQQEIKTDKTMKNEFIGSLVAKTLLTNSLNFSNLLIENNIELSETDIDILKSDEFVLILFTIGLSDFSYLLLSKADIDITIEESDYGKMTNILFTTHFMFAGLIIKDTPQMNTIRAMANPEHAIRDSSFYSTLQDLMKESTLIFKEIEASTELEYTISQESEIFYSALNNLIFETFRTVSSEKFESSIDLSKWIITFTHSKNSKFILNVLGVFRKDIENILIQILKNK